MSLNFLTSEYYYETFKSISNKNMMKIIYMPLGIDEKKNFDIILEKVSECYVFHLKSYIILDYNSYKMYNLLSKIIKKYSETNEYYSLLYFLRYNIHPMDLYLFVKYLHQNDRKLLENKIFKQIHLIHYFGVYSIFMIKCRTNLHISRFNQCEYTHCDYCENYHDINNAIIDYKSLEIILHDSNYNKHLDGLEIFRIVLENVVKKPNECLEEENYKKRLAKITLNFCKTFPVKSFFKYKKIKENDEIGGVIKDIYILFLSLSLGNTLIPMEMIMEILEHFKNLIIVHK